jgi:DivIVA domain-containing protein
MTPNDVDALRFGLAFRGYRMDQVDDALDRLREELRLRDERLAARAEAPSSGRSRPRVWQPPAEAPVEEAPVEQAPVAEAPVAEAPVAEAPVAEAPVEDAPVEDAPVDLPTAPPLEPEQPREAAMAPPPPAAAGEDRISKLRRPRPAPEQ